MALSHTLMGRRSYIHSGPLWFCAINTILASKSSFVGIPMRCDGHISDVCIGKPRETVGALLTAFCTALDQPSLTSRAETWQPCNGIFRNPERIYFGMLSAVNRARLHGPAHTGVMHRFITVWPLSCIGAKDIHGLQSRHHRLGSHHQAGAQEAGLAQGDGPSSGLQLQ